MAIRNGGGGDIEFGIRITADNQVFVDGVRASSDEVKKLGEGLKQVSKDAEGATRAQESLTGAVFKGSLATDLLIRATDFLARSLSDMKIATLEAQQSQFKLEAVLNATQQASGRTAAQINALAEALSKATRFDDQGIKQAAAQLATFDTIAGRTFDRTIRLGADLAAVFGGDLTGHVMSLAKALTEPATSLGALERQFGKFDAATKDAIKSALEMNDVVGAQKIILDELEGRVGGAAVNSYRGLERQIEGTKKAWDDLLRSFGNKIFDAQSRDAGVLENMLRAASRAVDSYSFSLKTLFTMMQGFRQGGPGGALFALANQSLEEEGARALAGPKPAPRQDVNAQEASREFQRLLEGASTASRFEAEWRHAMVTIVQAGKQGTAEAAMIVASIVEKYAKAPKKLADDGAKVLRELVRAAQEEEEKAEEARGTAFMKQVAALRDITEKSQLEVELLGESRGQAEYLLRVRELTQKVEREISDQAARGRPFTEQQVEIMREGLKIATDQLAAQRDIKAEREAQNVLVREQIALESSLWNDIANRGASFFAELLTSGRDAFDVLRSSLRSFASELIAFFSKRFILQIGAGLLSGTAAGAALAGQADALGQGSFLGAAGNFLGGLGGSMLAGVGSMFGGSFGAGLTYSGSAGLLAGLGEVGGAGSSLFQLGAAFPGIGTALAIAATLFSIFGKPGGGLKGGGSYFGSYDAGGSFLGNLPVPGSDNGRFYTPNSDDATIRGIVGNLSSSYFGTLSRLGGSAGSNVSFGLGYDTDPRGTASNRISSSVVIGGRQVFGSTARDIGRDESQIGPQLQLEASRALLAALQASELPETIGKIIRSLDVGTASAEAINNAIALSETFQQIFKDGSADVRELASDLVSRSSSSLAALRAQGDALISLADRFDGTTQSAQQLAAAQLQYRDSLVELLASIQVMQRELAGMFAQTRERIQLAGLSRQDTYRFFQEAADQRYAALLTATDPAEVQRLATEINSYFNRAFDLLSPEEQLANRQRFLDNLDRLDAAVNQRLENLADSIAEESSKPFQVVAAKLEEAADKMVAAGNAMTQAANTQLAAASKPLRVDVNVSDSRVNVALVNEGG